MLFIPKKFKFKKHQKGKSFNRINKNLDFNNLLFGSVGLKALESGRLNSKQIESIKQTINKIVKKSGRTFINVFPNTAISKKPLEIRMGKGKGAVDHWIFKVKAGSILCEIETNSIVLALKALKLAQIRSPIKTKIVYSNIII